jgi:hypothetical protein
MRPACSNITIRNGKMTRYAETTYGDRVAYDLYGAKGQAIIFVSGAGPYRAIDPITGGWVVDEAEATRGGGAVVMFRLHAPAVGGADIAADVVGHGVGAALVDWPDDVGDLARLDLAGFAPGPHRS